MTRWMKKAIAFGLAISIFAGCMVASAEEVQDNGISVVEEAVYDSAIALKDNVVLVENGHWSKKEADENTGEAVIYSDVTTETNIVFLDANGNKTVISNKDSNGEMLFDAVHPVITGLDGSEYIRIIKGNKAAYLKPDGSYLDKKGEFYEYAYVANDLTLLVSDDGVNYRVAGIEGVKSIAAEGFRYATIYDSNLYIHTDNKFIVADFNGNVYAEHEISGDVIYDGSDNFVRAICLWSGGYYVSSNEYTVVYNSDLQEIFRNEERSSLDQLSNDNLDYVLIYTEKSSSYSIIDAHTGELIKEYSERPKYENGIIIGKTAEGYDSLYDIEKKTTINIDECIIKLAISNGFGSYDSEYKYSNGCLVISLVGNVSSIRQSKTYILSSENDYSCDEAVEIEGHIGKLYGDKKMLTIENISTSILEKIYTTDGVLVKDFTENAEGEFTTVGADIKNIPEILDIGYTYGYEDRKVVVIKTNGEISKEYSRLKAEDRVLIGETPDGMIDIISSEGIIASYKSSEISEEYHFYNIGKWIYDLKYFDYYATYINNEFNLYDTHGNKISGSVDGLSGIGPCEAIAGRYILPTDFTVGAPWYYCYSNDDLENGLCVTRKTDEDGNYKYGVIKFNNILDKGDCNGDGKINAEDALAVLKHAAKISQLSDESVAEVTGDSKVNAEDALKILRYAAKIIDCLN